MQKNFKLFATVLLVIASNFGAIAQSETYKDVVLDGKPAKLNVKTGEIKLVEKDSAKGKTYEYKSNAADSTKLITTNRPDTLSQYYKKLHVVEDATNLEQGKVEKVMDDVILITSEKAKKATTLVYDTSSSTLPSPSSTDAASNGKYTKSTTDFHIVQKGETLYSLSKLYNVSLGQLKQFNNLETTLVQTGQNLQIRNFQNSILETTSVWIVSKGDTLYNIAHRNNTSVGAIKALNGLQSNLIVPGQKLLLK